MAASNGTQNEAKTKVEAFGVRGMASRPWRKTFRSQEAFEAWLERNEGDVQVHGTRAISHES